MQNLQNVTLIHRFCGSNSGSSSSSSSHFKLVFVLTFLLDNFKFIGCLVGNE